jgi:hypothetical protein
MNYIGTRYWPDTGFRLIIGYTEFLQLVTTSNYDLIANSRARLLTIALAKLSQFAFTSRC